MDIGAVEGFAYEPAITAASTTEDTATTSGLVISANPSDDGQTTSYLISNLAGGRLYRADTTEVTASNDSVTLSSGLAGLVFQPAANANDGNTVRFGFSVRAVTDGSATLGIGNPVPVLISVSAVNDVPLADSQTLTTNEDTATAITLTGSDTDGNALTYTITTPPTAAMGTLTGTAPNLTFTPTLDFNGPATFSFKVNDGTADSAPAQVTINVTPQNDAPIATAQSVTAAEDTAQAITLAGTDVDGDVLTFTIITSPANGTLTGTAPNLTYRSALNYNGPDSFTFLVNDGTVNSATATVSITVTASNDAPVAVAQSLTTPEDTAKAIVLTGNDADGDPLTYTIVSSPTNGTLTGTAPNLTYNPTLNFNGTASFTFKVNDGTVDSNIATISITVTAVNDAPTAIAQSLGTPRNTDLTLTLTGSDVENSPLTYTVVTAPTSGTLIGTAPNLTYRPNSNFVGADSLTFKVNDGTVDSAVATVNITVSFSNVAPVAVAQSVTTNEDTARSITLTGNDLDPDTLTFTVVNSPTNGTLSGTAPNLTYTPALNYNGADSFTFKVNDGTVDSPAATVSITVTAVNDVPVALAQSLTTAEETALAITLTGTDVDAGNPKNFSIVTPPTPAMGTLSGTAPNLTFTPTLNFTGPASFTFKINDGTTDSNTATIAINVTAVNDAPLAIAQSISTAEDTAKAITLTGTDADGDAITYTVVNQPTHGTLTGIAPNVTYTPALNYNGTDSFTFRVNDGTVNSATAMVSITVTASNDAPVAVAQNLTTLEDTAKAIVLTGTDVDGDPLTYTIVSSPTNGTLTGTAPNLTYNPALNFNGTASFTFKVNDGTVDSNIATISINVTDVNDKPTVLASIPAALQTRPGFTTSLTLSDYFSDVETASSELIYSITSSTTAGFYSANLTGSLLNLTGNSSGQTTLTLRATDPSGLFVENTLSYRVKHLPEAITAIPNQATGLNTPLNLDLSAYFRDQDSDAITYSVSGNTKPTLAGASISGTSTLSLTTLTTGSTNITVRATDSDGGSVSSSFAFTIGTANPTVTNASVKVLNSQTGLIVQTVTVQNTTGRPSAGFRLNVTGLPATVTLYSASSAPGVSPAYVDYPYAMAVDQIITLALSYYVPTRSLTFTPIYTVIALPTGISTVGTGAGMNITRFVRLTPGSVLLEFNAIPGRWYQVEYSSDLTNWKLSATPILAGANRVQWIDQGPPYTQSSPATTATRMYRVREIVR